MKLAVLFPMLLAAASPVQAASQAYEDPPIQVWLDQDGEFDRGDEARVWVRAARDGFLLVLHADAEGRIRVIFPLDPVSDDFVRGGVSLEVLGRGDSRALYIDERDGDGLVLAAWSADPFRFDAYVRGDHWDFRYLANDGSDRDAEAGLLDIVYRMADGRPFEYATAPYIVGRDRHYGGSANVYYSSVSYSNHQPWCYGCYDDWRFGFGFGFGLGVRSGFHLSVGFGSPHYYYGWNHRAYDPFYPYGHPIWYRPVWYDPFYWYRGRSYFAWDPFWYPYRYTRRFDPWPHYRYAGVGIHRRYGDDCWGDPFCRWDPYRGRSGYATGIAYGSDGSDGGYDGFRRDGYVTPRGYAQGRDRSGSTSVIGLSENLSRRGSVLRETAGIASARDDATVIRSEPLNSRTRSGVARRAESSAVASEPGGRTLSSRSLREAVQSEPPQRSSSATNRLREAVQSSPPQQRSSSTTNRLRVEVLSSPPQQRSSSATNRLREAVQSSPPQQRSSSTTRRIGDAVVLEPPERWTRASSRLREAAVSSEPPPQRSSSATSRLREAVQSSPPQRSSSSRANVRSVPDRSDQGITRAQPRSMPSRSGITRASPPRSSVSTERSTGSSASTRARSTPVTRSSPSPSASRSGASRASASASSRGTAKARGSGGAGGRVR